MGAKVETTFANLGNRSLVLYFIFSASLHKLLFLCAAPLFLCPTIASSQLCLLISYDGLIVPIRCIFANR